MPPQNKGFFHDPSADPEQWVLGATDLLNGEVLQEDRDWRLFRPTPEMQTRKGFDPLSCASYGSLNMIEMYLLRKFGVSKNYSDRWLAQKTGTAEKRGNDPHYVLEYIRRYGILDEQRWPFGDDINSIGDYYIEPDPTLDAIAADFNKDYELHHWTLRDMSLAWDALARSPLGISVGFNSTDQDGYWYKEGTHNDSHWTVCDYGDQGKYFGIFDSAEPSDKKAAWSKLRPQLAKYIQITKRPTQQQLGILAQILKLAAQWLALITGAPKPSATPVKIIQDESKPPEPTSTPPTTSDRSEELYAIAYASVGMEVSPADLADDELGCAESLSMILRKLYPDFPIILSTTKLNHFLTGDRRFKPIAQPMKGCISIFPTNGTSIGHCGVWGKNSVMSNNSSGPNKGKWTANYTHAAWLFAAKKRNLPVYHYLPL